jgi:LemA protein
MILLVILALPVLLVIWAVYTYNQFTRWKNLMAEAWSGVDVQLKRRHDLVPRLVETVKGYAGYEQELLQQITRLRTESAAAEQLKAKTAAENGLSEAFKQLIAVAEAYPELKAGQNFLELQRQLVAVEDEIQLARRYFNGAVRNYNILVQSFPSLIIAGLGHFQAADYFELESALERNAPQIQL